MHDSLPFSKHHRQATFLFKDCSRPRHAVVLVSAEYETYFCSTVNFHRYGSWTMSHTQSVSEAANTARRHRLFHVLLTERHCCWSERMLRGRDHRACSPPIGNVAKSLQRSGKNKQRYIKQASKNASVAQISASPRFGMLYGMLSYFIIPMSTHMDTVEHPRTTHTWILASATHPNNLTMRAVLPSFD
ncbi:hypothetical protein BDW72DRAFT_75829 [Aspergillus terricola var. indicus]